MEGLLLLAALSLARSLLTISPSIVTWSSAAEEVDVQVDVGLFDNCVAYGAVD